MLGKAVRYWGAAVNGEWGAGKDKNIKNGWEPFWSYKNWLASRACKKGFIFKRFTKPFSKEVHTLQIYFESDTIKNHDHFTTFMNVIFVTL